MSLPSYRCSITRCKIKFYPFPVVTIQVMLWLYMGRINMLKNFIRLKSPTNLRYFSQTIKFVGLRGEIFDHLICFTKLRRISQFIKFFLMKLFFVGCSPFYRCGYINITKLLKVNYLPKIIWSNLYKYLPVDSSSICSAVKYLHSECSSPSDAFSKSGLISSSVFNT